MSRLLYIKASPRGERSSSMRIANALVEEYLKANPGDDIIEVDIFRKDLPVFDGAVVSAKYAILHGQEHSDEEAEMWKAVEAVIDEFKAAEKYIVACPMWNFGIPNRMEQYLDIVVQPVSIVMLVRMDKEIIRHFHEEIKILFVPEYLPHARYVVGVG